MEIPHTCPDTPEAGMLMATLGCLAHLLQLFQYRENVCIALKKKEKLYPPKENETLSKHATISRHRDKGSAVQHVTNHQHADTFINTLFFLNIPSKYADIELTVDSVKKWQFVNFPLLTD